jgi:1-acyl-sn-glycerol-3-phosphate acyltransferase
MTTEIHQIPVRQNAPIFPGGHYQTPDRPITWFAERFPSLSFYPRLIGEVFHIASILRCDKRQPDTYAQSSLSVLRSLESAGVRIDIENLDVLHAAPDPLVLAANHMSSLETFALHSILHPRPAAFIIKRSLLSYPVFGPVLSRGGSIAVERKNPRRDLETVLREGTERLSRGVSVIVFPQTTRQLIFDSERFNTIAVKLARRAGAAILPLALKTDAWGFGRIIKDFGPIDPKKTVRFRFGEPMTVKGNGKAEHETIVRFIQGTLAEWSAKDNKHSKLD